MKRIPFAVAFSLAILLEWLAPAQQAPAGKAKQSKYVTGLAKVRWQTKQTGFHYRRPIVKLADGTWLVGDHAEPPSTDWREIEFSFVDVRWHYLNVRRWSPRAPPTGY